MAFRRRTVTCRWCYASGHNSSGCPAKKTYIKDNPDSWIATREAQKGGKKCSYCHNAGHTRTTCAEYKEAIRVIRLNVMENREKICYALTDMGLAPGSVVKTEVYERNKGWHTTLCLVEGILWENFCEQSGASGNPLEVSSLLSNQKHHVYLPRYSGAIEIWGTSCEIISSCSKEFAAKYNRQMMEQTNEKALNNTYTPRSKY